MPDIEVKQVAAFVSAGGGGNPAGVVTEARDLAPATRQAVASAVGWSETAFLEPSRQADYRIHFYTPTRQIARCGHATVASFALLAGAGRLGRERLTIETVDGIDAVRVQRSEVFLRQGAPRFESLDAAGARALASSLDVVASDLAAGAKPLVVDTGARFLLVPIRDRATLARIRPDQAAVQALSERLRVIGYYLFAPGQDGYLATTRMFAPAYGIDEEAATGMGAGCLAGLLTERLGTTVDQFLIEQGALMPQPSPSRIAVQIERRDGRIDHVWVGGEARVRTSRQVSYQLQ